MKRISFLALIAAVLIVLTPQSPLAEKKGTNRPLSGSLEGTAHLVFEQTECVGGPQTITIASGNLSHLGLVQAYYSHCPSYPGSGAPWTNERVIFVAANGDQLWGTYEGFDGQLTFEARFQGGTGRFKDAVGTGTSTYGIKPVLDENGNPDWSKPIQWWATIEASISY